MSMPIDALRAAIGVQRHSDWLVVDQDMIDAFAGATRDRQYIHVDPARAALTAFGGTIAHGFLILSLLPHLQASIPDPAAKDVKMIVNYGFDRLRFTHPVMAGSRVRALSQVVAVEEHGPAQFQQVQDISVEIDGRDRPALVATWRTLLTF